MFTKKLMTTIGVIVAILSLIGGIWTFGNTFATNEKVEEVKVEAKEDVKDLEIEIAGAFQNQQLKGDVRFWQMQMEVLDNELKELRRQMRRYPEDQALQEDYRQTLDRKNEVRKKMHESMSKIQ